MEPEAGRELKLYEKMFRDDDPKPEPYAVTSPKTEVGAYRKSMVLQQVVEKGV